MKADREHRVPLSPRAFEVLDEAAQRFGGDDLVFPSPSGKVPNHSLMATLLRELEIGAVPHGFRSSFRDWAAECTQAPREVCELALAHVDNDRVEAAYRRTNLFDRRRELMDAWAAHVASARPPPPTGCVAPTADRQPSSIYRYSYRPWVVDPSL